MNRRDLGVARVLRGALTILDTPARWTQGVRRQLRGDVMCFCAIGAIEIAAIQDNASIHVEQRAWEVLRDTVGESVVAWNDAPGRTHEEIVAGFRQAIERAEAA